MVVSCFVGAGPLEEQLPVLLTAEPLSSPSPVMSVTILLLMLPQSKRVYIVCVPICTFDKTIYNTSQ